MMQQAIRPEIRRARAFTQRWALALGSAMALSACAAVPQGGPSVAPPPPVMPSAGSYAKAPELMGLTARALTGMFGQPRLDIREQTMRKLQFANSRCVLDAYLYPQGKKEPAVAHVDARLPNGTDTDIQGCAATLRVK
jgi:hypothetical protein